MNGREEFQHCFIEPELSIKTKQNKPNSSLSTLQHKMAPATCSQAATKTLQYHITCTLLAI